MAYMYMWSTPGYVSLSCILLLNVVKTEAENTETGDGLRMYAGWGASCLLSPPNSYMRNAISPELVIINPLLIALRGLLLADEY